MQFFCAYRFSEHIKSIRFAYNLLREEDKNELSESKVKYVKTKLNASFLQILKPFE